MSSKLMPPNVGSSDFTICTNFSGSFSLISISNTSISAKILNNTPFPSITGLLASGPISPKPNTAVPLLMTATNFLWLCIYKHSPHYREFLCMAPQHPANKPVIRSRCVFASLVGITSIFPGLPLE